MPIMEELFNRPEATVGTSLTIGIVKENYNKDFPGMVKVELVMHNSGFNLIGWLRFATFYGGGNFGSYFCPEVGDEVIVAFDSGDPEHAYVIGSLWNKSGNIPPDSCDKKNTVKRILTKGGNEIVFSDEDKKQDITIRTKKKHKISINDDKEEIMISDSKGKNVITVDIKNGAVQITSENKISLKSGSEEIVMDGRGKNTKIKSNNLTIDGGTNLSIKGNNADIKAKMMNINSDSNMTVKAGALMTVKGSLVKIN